MLCTNQRGNRKKIERKNSETKLKDFFALYEQKFKIANESQINLDFFYGAIKMIYMATNFVSCFPPFFVQ